MRVVLFLFTLLWSTAVSAVEAGDVAQFRSMEVIVSALSGSNDRDVSSLFHKNATFQGVKTFPWDIAKFKFFLVSRGCSSLVAVDNQRVRGIARLTSKPIADTVSKESVSGPGLWAYCYGSSRITANELYTFYFEKGKVRRVYLTIAVETPGAPSRPATSEIPLG